MSVDLEVIQRIQTIETRLRSLERVELPVAGSGGFAPSDAQYLTLAASAGLSQERIFTPVAPLVGADGGAGAAYSLSVTPAALSRVNDTNVTLSLGGAPSTALLAAVSLTLGWAGQLSLARGGTASDLSGTGGSAQYLKQSSAGASITVGTIPASDIASGAALTKTDDTNVTLTLGGSPATALLAATSLTLGWTGQLAIARGGTGASTLAGASIVTASLTADKIPYASAATVLSDTGASGVFWDNANANMGLGLAPATSTDQLGLYNNGAKFFVISAFSSTVTDVAAIFTTKSQSNTIGTLTQTVTTDQLGRWTMYGVTSGSSYVSGAQIIAQQIGASTATRVPARLLIYTSDGSAATTIRTVVSPNGNYGVTTSALLEAGTSGTQVLFVRTGTAPSSSPADIFQIYSQDRGGTAGQAWPHIRTEDSTNGSLGVTVAEVNLTAQSAAIAATTLYAVPAGAGGVYIVYWVATVTTAATTSSILGGAGGMQVSYTDGNDSVVKTAPGTVTAGVNTNATNSTATGTITGAYTVFAKASTNIQYLIGYTSVGATAMQYNLHLVCRRLT